MNNNYDKYIDSKIRLPSPIIFFYLKNFSELRRFNLTYDDIIAAQYKDADCILAKLLKRDG